MSEVNRLDVWSIQESENREGKSWWTRVGTAFRNRDGSINVILDALPIAGKLNIREPRPRETPQS